MLRTPAKPYLEHHGIGMMTKAHVIYTEAVPDSYEYMGNGKILASLKTSSGETAWFVIPAGAFVASIQLASDCLNENASAILRDIGVF